MPPRALFVCLVPLALTAVGCHSARSQARSAAEAGDLRRALALYDEALGDDPNDAGARAERQATREHLASQLLTAGERAALDAAYEDALRNLAEVCALEDQWREPLASTVGLRFAALRDTMQTRELARLDGLASAGRFLDGAKVARNGALACSGLAPMRKALTERASELGAARCAKLEAAAKQHGPYAQSLVERACITLGAPPNAHVTLPHQVSTVTLNGSINGASAALVGQLQQRFAAVLAKTPLFDAAARSALEVVVAGYVRHTVRRTPTTLSHSWTESVPYQATEDYQESYQEPYTDTEYYTDNVPYTRYEYVNGRSVPRTAYRSESKHRTVTKYRTAFRTRTRPVTRYRAEPRVFTHAATHVEATYEAAFTAEAFAPTIGTFPLPVAHTESNEAYEHSASFAPANVQPSSGNVPSLEEYFRDDAELVARRFMQSWFTNFTTMACKGPAFRSPEEGARCAWLGAKEAPDQAFLALAPLFGADVPALAELPSP